MHRILVAIALALVTLDGSAAVSGYVLDPDGKPIAGARVRAVALATADEQFERYRSASPEPVALAAAQTDGKGAFRLDTKRQPVVTLLIDAPGRLPLREEVADGDTPVFILRSVAFKKGRVTANGKPVPGALVVTSNLYLRTDEKGEYSAPPDPTRIYVVHPDFAVADQVPVRDTLSLDVSLDAGRSVTGRVVDASGRPVANAVVRSRNWPLPKSAEDGSFTVAHIDAKAVNTLYAVVGNRMGTIKGDTIVVRPVGTVAGTVRSSKDELPVAGVRVAAQIMTNPATFVSAITDAKGAFVLPAVPAGVQLTLSHPAFMSASVDSQAADGRRVERSLTIAPWGRLSGTVVDDEKRPLGGVRIQTGGADPRAAVTAPDGTFALRLPPMPVTLMATKPSYPAATHGPVRVSPGEVKSGVRIVMPRGKAFEIVLVDTTGVPLVNEPLLIGRRLEAADRYPPVWVRCSEEAEAPASCRTNAEGRVAFSVSEGVYDIRAGGETTVLKEMRGQNLAAETSPLTIELERGALVEGRVVWSDGTPVTTVAHVTGTDPSAAGAVVTNGTFAMRNVPAGKVSLVARAGPPAYVESEPVDVTAPASGVVLTIPRVGRIEGRVLDRENQRPIRQFTVSTERRGTMRRGNSITTFTADDGRFVLEDVAPGAQDVVVTAPGFVRSTTSNVAVPEGKTATVEVTLERGGTVAGRVTSSGRPVTGAHVSAGVRARRPSENKQTDANGDYLIDTLSTGTHELVVRKEGYVTRTISVNVSAGKETRGDVELVRGREVTGRVIDTSGRPIAGADVTFNPSQGSGASYTMVHQSDPEGHFRLEGLGDEPYTVVASKSGYVEARAEITPATPSVTLTLSRGGSLSGRVSGLSPAEMSTVEVAIMSRGGSRSVATPDATGAFTLTGVPDGDVTVTASMYRPRHRSVQTQVKVVSGTGPFVDLDFAAGLIVRGRVTLAGQPVRGMVHLVPTANAAGGAAATSRIQNDGTYEARVNAPGQYRFLVTMNDGVGTMEIETIDVRGEMEHDVEVRGGPLRVRVADATTGVPVPEAMVSLMPAERGRSISSSARPADSSGWAAWDFVVEARYVVRAQKEGYASGVQEVAIENGRGADVDLSLGPAELVLVTVLDEETGAPAEAFIGVLDSAGRRLTVRPPQRDPGGAYRLWLGPGTYTLNVMGRLHEPAKVSLTVPGTPAVLVKLPRKKG